MESIESQCIWGCADGSEIVLCRNTLTGKEFFSNFEDLVLELNTDYGLKFQKYSNTSEFIDCSGYIETWDSFNNKFVHVKKLIRNNNVQNWRSVEFDNGLSLKLTGDHPLPVNGKGRTFVDDLELGDEINISTKEDFHDHKEYKEAISCKVIKITQLGFAPELYSYDFETESDRFDLSGIQSHNCRTRVLGNDYDPEHAQTTGRGNLFFTTLNLPYMALEVINDNSIGDKIEGFFKLLEERMDDALKISRRRFEYIATRKAKNFPFLMGQHLYLSSEKLGPDDEIREVIKQGSLSIGFIGLAETLKALTGKHHGESSASNELGMKIIGYMHEKCDEYTKQEGLNYSLFATPAEGCSGRLMRAIQKKFGKIPGVSDKEYLTNSFHVPVYYQCTAEQKINIEAPYHPLCTAGCIGYVELSYEATRNIDAFETLVNAMADSGMTYFSINHPVDYDPVCGYVGYIPGDTCPRCGRKEGEGILVDALRKLKVYRPSPEFTVD